MTSSFRDAWWLAASAAALVAAIGTQAVRDVRYPTRQVPDARMLYIRSAPTVKRLTLEFNAIAADVYWVRALQHYGGDRLANRGRRTFELLQPLLDLTTTLDPLFTIAYRFGGIFLSEDPPGGPGRPDQAIALLQKGIAAQPGRWEYFHDIAFVQYWHLHDAAAAAQWFERAADQPGAPNWLRPLAATVLTSHDRTAARFLWQRLLQSDQPWLRRTASRSLAQLQALDDRDTLQARVSAASPPGPTVTWTDLVRRGVLSGLPLDPTGVPYALDPVTGRVGISPASSLNPLPELARPAR